MSTDAAPAIKPANLMISLFDGTRQPIATGTKVLVRVLDGNQKEVLSGFFEKANVFLEDVPFSDNFADNYTVVVSSDGYSQAGFTPVPIKAGVVGFVDLMLIPNPAAYDFSAAKWSALPDNLRDIFASGADTPQAARDRYAQLLKKKPDTLAALLNITTALSQIQLASGSALGFFKQLLWDDTLAQDRFFAFADPQLLVEVKRAVDENEFAPEFNPGFFHPGATSSFKELDFGEANIQLTFHEGTTQVVDGVTCIQVEPDIDYYRDLLAHGLLEVLPNAITQGKTDPRQVYVLRWMAGRHAGFPNFDPPYAITKA